MASENEEAVRMKKICVVTATRAEYGVLKNTIRRIQQDDELELCLAVTGTHLSVQYGNTVEEIREDGFPVAEEIPILTDRNDAQGVTETMGRTVTAFGEMFERQKPDMLVVVGDRYELLAICSAAVVFGIPIVHVSGGEVTEGAIDDVIRHAMTKMSHLHFPGCEVYRKRIVQMGEAPERVFNYGDVGVENLRTTRYLTREELEASLHISLEKPYAMVTFHPVTLEKNTAGDQIMELLQTLEQITDMQFIITKANADVDGSVINECIDRHVAGSRNCTAFFSVGIQRYLSLLKYCEFVIGNSSSGLIEAPSFGIPTINIGDRQKGRLQAESVLNCKPFREDIARTIAVARGRDFREKARLAQNPYGDGNTSEKIVEEIKRFFREGGEISKHFYDVAFELDE